MTERARADTRRRDHSKEARAVARVTALLLALAASALLLASCGGGASTTTTVPVTVTTAPPAPLADGEHFGFVRDLGDSTITLDPAELLSGEAALTAAREDGVIGEAEDLPNDFYIRDLDGETVELTVGPGAEFTLVGLDASDAITDLRVSFDEFTRYWEGIDDSSDLYGFVAGELPMTISVAEGVAAGGVQQYLP